MVQISVENSPPLSKGEGLRDIGHSMSIVVNLILGVNSVTVSYLTHYDSLLQNATDILLQNATAILLQNGTGVYYKMPQVFIITNCDSFITKCDRYYKLRQYNNSPLFLFK